jgi:hypothetical protein
MMQSANWKKVIVAQLITLFRYIILNKESIITRGVQNNRLTKKTDKTEEKLTEKSEPKWKTDLKNHKC